MRVFVSHDFTGLWPVGTAAIVVAYDRTEAHALIEQSLASRGLVFDGTLQEVALETPHAIVLRDGNY